MPDAHSNALNFAIIGCGRIGKRHASHIAKFGTLAAVCDTDAGAASDLAAEFGAAAYTDLDEMLRAQKGAADVMSVCTPNYLHAPHSIAAFKAGYHVICEKPMAINVHDCGEMIKAAEIANRRLFVVKQNRYNPPVQHLKSLIDAGSLGRIFSVQLNCFWNRNDKYFESDWKGQTDKDGGTLYTQFSHFIDLIYWLIGDVKDVYAMTDNFSHSDTVEFEDSGVAALRFYNGALGTIHFTINAHQKNMEGSITVFCERGTVKIGGQYLNEIEYHNVQDIELKDLPVGRPANQYGDYQGSMSNHEDVYKNVSEVLQSDGQMGVIGIEGLKTVEIIDKIYRAAGRG